MLFLFLLFLFIFICSFSLQALLEYEKHKIRTGELRVPVTTLPEPMTVDSQVNSSICFMMISFLLLQYQSTLTGI